MWTIGVIDWCQMRRKGKNKSVMTLKYLAWISDLIVVHEHCSYERMSKLDIENDFCLMEPWGGGENRHLIWAWETMGRHSA